MDFLHLFLSIFADVSNVEELSGPRGTGYHEAVELCLVLHVDKVPHVALEIGGDVIGVKGVPFDGVVLQL